MKTLRWAGALAACVVGGESTAGALATPKGSALTGAQGIVAPDASVRLGFRLQPGATSVYRLRSVGGLEVDYGLLASSMTKAMGGATVGTAGASRRERSTHDLSATLHWRVVGQDAKGWVLAARLQDVDFRVDGVSDARRDMLEQPFIIKLDRTGVMREFVFLNKYPEALQRAVRGLVEPLQVVLPEETGAAWVAQEATAELAFEARYKRDGIDGAAGVARLTKTKASVTASPAQLASLSVVGRPETRLKRSDTTIDFALSGRGVERLETVEEVATYAGKALLVSHSGTFTAVRVDSPVASLATSTVAAVAGLSDPAFARARMYDVATEVASEVEGLDVTAVMVAYEKALGENTAVGHRLLKNYVRRYPARTLEVARALDRYTAADEHTVVGFGFAALASAGHVEAQQVLVQAMSGTAWRPLAKEKALVSMMELEAPEPFVLAAVWALRSSLRATGPDAMMLQSIATNVYGALGDVRKGNVAVTDEVVRTLGRFLQDTNNPRQQEFALDALSNVGDFTRVSPLAAPLFTSPNTDVRVRAFSTFRRMEGDAAFAQFASRYARETSVEVRREASHTAADMALTGPRNEWARREITTTTDHETLGVLVRMVGQGLERHPENEAVLRDLLKTNHDRRIRREIYAFVAPTRAGVQ